MKKPFIDERFVIFLFCVFLINCNNKKQPKQKDIVEIKKDSIEFGLPKFLNCLNLPEMKFPAIGHFSSAKSFDTLDFAVKESDEYLYDFSIFSKKYLNIPLHITIASEFHSYDEGDLDGDGTNEIGILPGYTSSACRSYVIYSFAKHKWKLLYTISSHLADRELGIDYVKRQGDSIRILSADYGCCQCFGLDTTYIKLTKLK